MAKLNLKHFKVELNEMTDTPTGHCIYTDGSKLNGNVGAGWVISLNNTLVSEGSIKLPNHSSVYEAEVIAIIKAADDFEQSVINKGCKPSIATFLVDNQSALMTLQKVKLKGRLPVKLVERIMKLETDHGLEVRFQWVRSHVGTVGNELADCKAKEGTVSNTSIALDHSLTFVKARAKEIVTRKWHNIWNNLNDCRQSRQIISFTPDKSNRDYILRSTRTKCRKIVALATGHNNMAYHTFKRLVATNPEFSPCCRFCKEGLETSWHLLQECPVLDERRRELEYGPDNPKKGPDIQSVYERAVHLGIMDIVLEPLEGSLGNEPEAE